ncbi:MAG TPA: sulfite exporter TauE/SafE family protein [Beijerinckiaceae bacterium]|nr:sulfite exporter TauE/SafE family protein [Beijerinckiaceae bacterium]
MLLDTSMLLAGLGCAVIIGMAKGGLSGGLGTLVVPILSLSMDPRAAAALVLPLLIISDFFAIWAFRHRWHWGHTWVLLVGAALGVVFGTFTFSWVSEPAMRLMMGVISVAFVAANLTGATRAADTPQPPALGAGVFWGALSGFTSFTAHAGGPPVQIYLVPRGLDKRTFQATVTLFFTILNLAKVPPYMALGQFTQPIMLTALVLMPAAAIGVFIGFRITGLIPEKPFFRLVLFLLGITGLKLMWDGLTGLGWL